MSSSHKQLSHLLYRLLFFWSLPFIFLSFILPVYSRIMKASALETAGLFSIFTATILFLHPIVGWTLDRFGRKGIFVTALWIYVIAMVAFSFAHNLTGFYVARLIQGIGAAFMWSAVNTIIADFTTQEDRGREMGRVNKIITWEGLTGIIAGSTLLFILPEVIGWRVTFISYAAINTFGAIMASKYLPETLQRRNISREKHPVSRQILNLLVVAFISGAAEGILGFIYIIYLQDTFTKNLMVLAAAFLPAELLTVFMAKRLGGLSDRFDRAKIMAAGMAAAGAISLFLPWISSLVWLAVFYSLSSAMWALSEPAETSMVAEISGRARRGTGYGLYALAGNLGYTIGPLAGGFLYDTSGYKMPFYMHGAILLAGAAWALLFLRRIR